MFPPRSAPAALLLAAVAAAAPAAPVPDEAKAPVLFFPTTVGTKWVYDQARGGPERIVVATVEKAGGGLVVGRAGADGSEEHYLRMVVSPAGLRQDFAQPGGPPVTHWVLKVPPRAGDSWPVPDFLGGGVRTVRGEEVVAVPAGRFTCTRVVWDRADGRQWTFWYAPGLGEVKRVERGADGSEAVTRALRSFSPGRP